MKRWLRDAVMIGLPRFLCVVMAYLLGTVSGGGFLLLAVHLLARLVGVELGPEQFPGLNWSFIEGFAWACLGAPAGVWMARHLAALPAREPGQAGAP